MLCYKRKNRVCSKIGKNPSQCATHESIYFEYEHALVNSETSNKNLTAWPELNFLWEKSGEWDFSSLKKGIVGGG